MNPQKSRAINEAYAAPSTRTKGNMGCGHTFRVAVARRQHKPSNIWLVTPYQRTPGAAFNFTQHLFSASLGQLHLIDAAVVFDGAVVAVDRLVIESRCEHSTSTSRGFGLWSDRWRRRCRVFAARPKETVRHEPGRFAFRMLLEITC